MKSKDSATAEMTKYILCGRLLIWHSVIVELFGEAVVPCFSTHNTRSVYDSPLSVKGLDLFMELSSIESDPGWCVSGVCIVCVLFVA